MTDAQSIVATTEQENETIARQFVQAWSDRDVDTICSLLTEDIVYMIYEGGPIETGIEAIRKRLIDFMKKWKKVEFEIGRLTVIGPLVIHDRIEDYYGVDGHPDWHFEVAAMLVIKDGKISIWRDYGMPGGRQSSPMPEN